MERHSLRQFQFLCRRHPALLRLNSRCLALRNDSVPAPEAPGCAAPSAAAIS